MAVHQANYARILSLRQTTVSLDETIKSTTRLLADARKDLLSIPAPLTPTIGHNVQVDELLSYAKFISKTTVPPTFRPNDILPTQATDAKNADTPAPMTQITNGIATPAAAGHEEESAVQAQAPGADGKGTSVLDPRTKEELENISRVGFDPWPSQDLMNNGALGQIELMLEDGKDPNTVLSQEEQEAEDRRKEEEAQRLREEEEDRDKRRREMFAMGGGRRQAADDEFDPDEA